MLPTSTPEIAKLDANLIQSTFLIIKQKPDEFATSFYHILFDKYPKVRSLFSETDMKKQKTKLLESLDLVLVNVHSPEGFGQKTYQIRCSFDRLSFNRGCITSSFRKALG
jgi:hemoglobin-like flavoprotein